MTDPGQALELPAFAGLEPEDRARLARLWRDSTAPATVRAYAADLRYFDAWHRARFGQALPWPVPAATALAHIADHVEDPNAELEAALSAARVKARAGRPKTSTLKRRFAALAAVHRLGGLPSPTTEPAVAEALRRLRRAARARGESTRKAPPFPVALWERLRATFPDTPVGRRNRALLGTLFAAGGRRPDEMARLRIDDLTPIEYAGTLSYVLRLPSSKANQDGRPESYLVAGTAARDLADWIQWAKITEGHVFRSIAPDRRSLRASLRADEVTPILRRALRQAGIDDTYSARSLRSGFATAALRHHPLGAVMAATGHRTFAAFKDYILEGEVTASPVWSTVS